MRILSLRLLMGLVNVLIFFWLFVVIPAECIGKLLTRWADRAEIEYLLAGAEKKIRGKS